MEYSLGIMDITKLEKIGLNLNEAKIYLALLELGQAQAGDISKKTQINRTTVYDSIERLIQNGLVSFVISANKKVFKPVAPKKLLSQIEEKENAVKEILPELEGLFAQSKEKEETDIYKGRKGIKSILDDILKCKGYVAFGSSGKFLEIMQHDFIIFQKQKKELKIDSRVILSESSRKTETVKVAFANFRYIPNEFSAPTTTFVFNEKVAIIIWGETPVATLIKSKDVAKSYKNYFEMLWKIAKS
jgi:sugar-specific transcriptional regulator TrmB